MTIIKIDFFNKTLWEQYQREEMSDMEIWFRMHENGGYVGVRISLFK